MTIEPQLTFASDPTLITATGTLLAALVAAAGTAILVPAVTRSILPKPKETHLADFLPFEAIDRDGRTVLMKDGSYTRYYILGGLDQSFMDTEQALWTAKKRMTFLDSLAEINVVARIFTLRRKMPVISSSEYPNPIAAKVAEKWNSQFREAYRTLNIIALSGKSVAKLEEAEQSMISTLSSFDVRSLTQDPTTNSARMTLGEFLGSQVSPSSCPSPKNTGTNLSDVLAGDIVWFRPDGIIEFTSGQEKKYALAIGLKRIGDDMSATMATELSSLNMEMTISRYVEPMSKTEAIIKLEQHSRLATASSFNPAATIESFAEAQAMVEGSDDSRASLCAYSQTIFIYASSIEEILKNEIAVRQVISSNGATAVRETGASQASWFLQFPTLDLLPRPYKLFSFNIAFDFMLDKPATGFDKSDWGNGSIANFQTLSNTVYQHQFHISDQDAALGHGVVIAPTGSGKTVLMEFLSLMASRHTDVKHFFFDRYRGTAIYNLAMGGKYLSLNSEPLPWSEAGGMNPFDCEDTKENRSFLKLWLSSISGCDKNEDITEISDAVDLAFDELERGERSLSTIHEAAFSPGSRIRKELAQWVSATGHGPVFNAERDAIDIEDSWLTTFDMTRLLDDPKLGAATVHYLMHKIRDTMRRNEAPGFIFIDETEPLLRDPNFKKLFAISLQEFRKIHGVVISVFQRPEAIREAGVSQLVRQQSGTYYLFQNPGARASDYAEFELSERELAFVLGQSGLAKKAKRSILIKRPLSQESVIVDVDLSSLGPHLKIFSSSSSDVSLVSELYQKLDGKWIERYIHHDAP
jgi:type IV secretion/conjugal transfer VirB4 family ATPase